MGTKLVTFFLVDIHFNKRNASEKQLFFNEIYSPIFEKKKFLSANERSVFQLLDAMRLDDKGTVSSCKTTAKTHETTDEKIAILLYAEHLHFLLTRSGWKVTKIKGHYIFEQKKFKNNFVIMNQVLRQNGKTDVEKNFFELMDNVNFGYDCRNNADNCYFSPIYNELEELMYAKRYQNIFDQSMSEFVLSEYPERQIQEEFSSKIARLDSNNEYYDSRKNSLEIPKKKNLILYFPCKNCGKKSIKKNTIKEVDEKIKDEEKCPKTKSIIEFD